MECAEENGSWDDGTLRLKPNLKTIDIDIYVAQRALCVGWYSIAGDVNYRGTVPLRARANQHTVLTKFSIFRMSLYSSGLQ